MKIFTIVGARPQFIKAAMGSRALRKFHKEILVHTGQHFDNNMSKVFFDEMNISKPDYNLGISGGSHATMTSKMLVAIEELLLTEKPNALLVYGDTNSTLAAALAAVKLHIPIMHIESGNRLGNLDNPEEVNRKLTDHISKIRFCATDEAYKHLKNEGLLDDSYVVGNIMYDAYLYYSSKKPNFDSYLDLNNEKLIISNDYYLLTCHREENTADEKLLFEILKAMNQLDAITIYPVHPRNRDVVKKICYDNNFDNVKLIYPVGYIESLYLTNHAKKVVTDSGGLQCEAFYAGVQCVTIFNNAVWPETMLGNRNQLSKPNSNEILDKLSKKQVVDKSYMPFGDGHSAEKIVNIINKYNF